MHVLATEATPAESSSILDKSIQMRNTILATKTVCDHDPLAIGVARDFEHLMAIGNDIARIAGVKDLRVSIWVEKTEQCPKYLVV